MATLGAPKQVFHALFVCNYFLFHLHFLHRHTWAGGNVGRGGGKTSRQTSTATYCNLLPAFFVYQVFPSFLLFNTIIWPYITDKPMSIQQSVPLRHRQTQHLVHHLEDSSGLKQRPKCRITKCQSSRFSSTFFPCFS